MRAFHKLVPKVKAEAGCLEYGPTVDAPTSIKAQIPVQQMAREKVWANLLKEHLPARSNEKNQCLILMSQATSRLSLGMAPNLHL